MAILTNRQKKTIERKIKDYWHMKAEIDQWREKVITGSKREHGERRDSHSIADPTGVIGRKLAEPPSRIRTLIGWCDAIDVMRKNVKDTKKEQLLDIWYWSNIRSPISVAVDELEVSRKQVYLMLSEMTVHTALIAVNKGVFDVLQ